MSKAPIAVIEVHMGHRDGWYYASSPDMPELHVCGEDHKAVLKDVCPVIKKLYKLNYNLDVEVTAAAKPNLEPAKPLAGFKELVRLLAFPVGELQPA